MPVRYSNKIEKDKPKQNRNMTKQEFEQRIGAEVTDEQFRGIHESYMLCGDSIDKDIFCRLYKEYPKAILEMVRKEQRVRAAEKKIEEAVKWMMRQDANEDAQFKIIDLLGEQEGFIRLLENDIELASDVRNRMADYIRNR